MAPRKSRSSSSTGSEKLEKELQKLREENQNLKDQLHTSKKEHLSNLNKLSSESEASLQRSLSDLAEQFKNREGALSGKEFSLAAQSDELKRLIQVQDSSVEKIAELETELNSQKEQSKKLEEEINTLDRKIDAVGKEKQAVEAKVKASQETEISLQQKINELGDRLKHAELESSRKQLLHDSETNEVKQLFKKQESLLANAKELETKLNFQKEEYKKQQEALRELDRKIQVVGNEKNDIQEKVKIFHETEVVSRSEKLKETEAMVFRAQDELDERRKTLDNLNDEIVSAKNKLSEASKKIPFFEQKIDESDKKLGKLNAELEYLKSELRDKTAQKNEFIRKAENLEHNELAKMQEQLKRISDDITNANLKVFEFQKNIQETTKQIVPLEKRYNELKKKQETMEAQLTVKKDEQRKIIEETGRLEVQAKEKSEQKSKYPVEIKRLEEIELPKVQAQLKKVDEELAPVQAEFKKHQEILLRVEKDHAPVNAKYQETFGYVKSMEKRLEEQKTLFQKLIDERVTIEERINTKTKEKESLAKAIKELSESVVPRQQEEVKKIWVEIKQAQDTVNQYQKKLAELLREIPVQNGTLRALQAEEAKLKIVYKEAKNKWDMLSGALRRLERDVNDKDMQVIQGKGLITQFKTSIDQYNQLMESTKNSIGLTAAELGQKQDEFKWLQQAQPGFKEGKIKTAETEAEKSRLVFWVAISLAGAGLIGVTVWQVIVRLF
ncbi:MAG: hypothetical protein HY811_08145 [Planctomycetes bacterium]|nr:hypothetical protein [Planctomycetota bacterium]